MKHCTALTAFPSAEIAKKVSQKLVENHLAACVNLIPGVESIYRWDGELCCDKEVLAMIKTSEHKLTDLKVAIKEWHPYDVPEMIVMEIQDGLDQYLEWLTSSLS